MTWNYRTLTKRFGVTSPRHFAKGTCRQTVTSLIGQFVNGSHCQNVTLPQGPLVSSAQKCVSTPKNVTSRMRHLVKKRQFAKEASLDQKSLSLYISVTSPMQHSAKKASPRQKLSLGQKGSLCQKIAIWPKNASLHQRNLTSPKHRHAFKMRSSLLSEFSNFSIFLAKWHFFGEVIHFRGLKRSGFCG